MRAIDADILLEKLQRMIDYCKNDNQVNGLTALFQVGDAIMDCPTLTPPNEPMTLEQLREMDGEPVWVDDEKIWALLQVWDDDNIDVVFPMPRGCFHAKSVLGKKIYRWPPEGEI